MGSRPTKTSRFDAEKRSGAEKTVSAARPTSYRLDDDTLEMIVGLQKKLNLNSPANVLRLLVAEKAEALGVRQGA